MRTLMLYRHAKSSWDDWSLDDFERPLSQRGIEAAPLIGDYITQNQHNPDRILCSPALRTRQTLKLTLPDLAADCGLDFARTLYLASDLTILHHIQQVSDKRDCLMIVAHNPGIHSLAKDLASKSEINESWQKLDRKFPTAGLAIFEVTTNYWREIAPSNCWLTDFVTPKILRKRADNKNGTPEHPTF